jgi:hypothetical protein
VLIIMFFGKKMSAQQFATQPTVSRAFGISFAKDSSLPVQLPLRPLPGDYYARHLSFFCRQELHLEKASRMAFRFRLGSLSQCNYLEGKK